MNGQSATPAVCSLAVPVAVLFFAIVAFVRGRNATEPSRRLAGVSLACGLLLFAPFELAFGLTAHNHPTAFRVAGVTRIVLGVVGVAWGVRALRRRRLDRGTGAARPLNGALLSAGEAAAGGFFLTLTSSAFAPGALDPETAWVYRHPDHGVEITLPSANWRESAGPGGLTFFVHRVPSMHAGIFRVEPAAPEAAFREFAARFNGRMSADPNRNVSMRTKDGTNQHGHKFVFATCVEQSGEGGRVFVGSGITWCEDRGVLVQVMFEGKPRFVSRAGEAEEMHTMETCAEAICLSIK